MKIKSERDKRTYLIIALCAVLVIMGVGYAAFSQMLTINGTANISNSWCVGFDNTKTNAYVPKAGITGATAPTGSMSYSGTACESTLQPASSLTAHFYQPGDEIEYTLTIVNKSSVTAAIKSILVDNESVTSNTTKTKNNITYIVNMPEETTLAPNASTTMKVIARFQNETEVTGNVNGQTETIEVKINTEQDDGNGGMDITPVSNKFTGSIYRWSSTKVNNGDSIATVVSETKWCLVGTVQGQSYNSCEYENYIDSQSECETYISNAISGGYIQEGDVSCQQKIVRYYTTDASTLGKTYYLKHDVVDDIITASYACQTFGISGFEPVCIKYSSDGSEYGYDAGGNHTENAGILNALNSNTTFTGNNPAGSCDFDSAESKCYAGNLDLRATPDGHVYADDYSAHASCRVDGGGAYCMNMVG